MELLTYPINTPEQSCGLQIAYEGIPGVPLHIPDKNPVILEDNGTPLLAKCCNYALANQETDWLNDGVCNTFDIIPEWDQSTEKCEVDL